jgi:hypothetical protein
MRIVEAASPPTARNGSPGSTRMARKISTVIPKIVGIAASSRRMMYVCIEVLTDGAVGGHGVTADANVTYRTNRPRSRRLR